MEKSAKSLSDQFDSIDEEYQQLMALPGDCAVGIVIYNSKTDRISSYSYRIVDQMLDDNNLKAAAKTEYINLARKIFGRLREKKLKELQEFVAEME